MCHLTQTGQVHAADLDPDEIVAQMVDVVSWYEANSTPARVVHINFMARGEPFANRHILATGADVVGRLCMEACRRSLIPRIKFSSIFPLELSEIDSLAALFGGYNPDLYYSIYSVDRAFRKRWLPQAMDPRKALEMLKQYQLETRKIPVLHFAFIAGENDSERSVEDICAMVNDVQLRVDFNIVRYNPHSARVGTEPNEGVIERNVAIISQSLPEARVKVVPRVGFDVKASCGMFVAGEEFVDA
jgi:adenine C2-methylase RlmN of 23S rRNA A2503 and tRNA A37